MTTDNLLVFALGAAAAAITSVITAFSAQRAMRSNRQPSSGKGLGPNSGRLSLVTSLVSVGVGIMVVFTSTGLVDYFRYLTNTGDSNTPITRFVGGCPDFIAYAQNVWEPTGASARAAPSISSPQLGGYAGNQRVILDGWVRGRPAYPTNPPPWNSEVWFHLANNSGWISYAGIRTGPTDYDPTSQAADQGHPVPTLSVCEGVAGA